jgi:hypothetical protein
MANLFAQTPDTLWTKTYGGTSDDEGFSTCQTVDSGFIIVGRTASFGAGSYDVYLIKTDENGGTLWTKTYGGANNELGHEVQQTSDNGYIIAGGTNSFGSDWEVYLIKTDSLGDTIWTRTYENGSTGYSVQQTSDSGYIIGGKYGGLTGDVCLIKTDENGDTLWTKKYGGAYDDAGYAIRETSDKGYIIAGETRSFGAGYYDIYLIKTDSLGDSLWAKTYGGVDDEQGWSVQQTADNGYFVAGYTTSSGAGSKDFYLVKTDTLGNVLWTKTHGGASNEAAKSVQQTSDGGYIITGYTTSFGAGAYDVYVVRTDSLGDSLWTKTYGGTNNERAWSVQQTSDTGYIITGGTYSFGTAGSQDVWLIKTEPEPVGIAEDRIANPLLVNLKIYPNPFSELTIISFSTGQSADGIELKIYDVSGRMVKDFILLGTYSLLPTVVCWDGCDNSGKQLSSGVYFCQIKTENIHLSKQVVLLR